MPIANRINPDRARELFRYDADLGTLHWRVWSHGRRKDLRTGLPDKAGYCRTRIDGRLFLTHRVVWAMRHGDLPVGIEIDHIDGDPSNNRLNNLRLATPTQNQHNQTKIRKTNTSGVSGVYFSKKLGKYVSRINIDGVMTHIGVHTDLEQAKAARQKAERLHYPFAPINRQRSTIHVTF